MSRMLTVDEAVEVLVEAGWKTSRSTVYELVQRGEIPHVRLGRRVRIARSALAPYLGETNRTPTAANGDGRMLAEAGTKPAACRTHLSCSDGSASNPTSDSPAGEAGPSESFEREHEVSRGEV